MVNSIFSGSNAIESVDIEGCRRRTSTSSRRTWRFRCSGMEGPPCTLKRGDTVQLRVTFRSGSHPLTSVSQSAHWVTNFGMELPWAGLDTNLCPYMSNSCNGQVQSGQTSMAYDIHINRLYPAGYYNLKWQFQANNNPMVCFRFAIRIV